MDKNVKVYWRLGVRDKKNWNYWEWSPEYETFNECVAAYSAWLQQNPGRVIAFSSRTVTFNPQTKGAQR